MGKCQNYFQTFTVFLAQGDLVERMQGSLDITQGMYRRLKKLHLAGRIQSIAIQSAKSNP